MRNIVICLKMINKIHTSRKKGDLIGHVRIIREENLFYGAVIPIVGINKILKRMPKMVSVLTGLFDMRIWRHGIPM